MANFVPFAPAPTDHVDFITSGAQSVERMVEKVGRAERDLNRRLLELRRAEAQAASKIAELHEAEERIGDLSAVLLQHSAKVGAQRELVEQQAAKIDAATAKIEQTALQAEDRLAALVPQLGKDLQKTVDTIEEILGERIEARMNAIAERLDVAMTERLTKASDALEATVQSLEERLTTLDSNVDGIVELIRERVAAELADLADEQVRLSRERAEREAQALARPFQQRIAELKSQAEFTASRINDQLRLTIDQYRTRAAETMRAATGVRYAINPADEPQSQAA